MVKIVVISDLHLGFKSDSELEGDSYIQASEAFIKALGENPDLILLLGDLFHKKIPSQETLGKSITFFSELKKQFNKYIKIHKIENNKFTRDKRIPAIISIYGTHERRNPNRVNPVHILEKANLLYCLNKESILVQINGQRIGIHGLSGVHDHFAKEELKKWNPKPIDNALNLFLVHQTFKELIPTNSYNFLEFKDLPIGFDVYLLGHIHWKFEGEHPVSKKPIIIPGSTIRTQLREIESTIEKGFYLLNFLQDRLRINFVNIETRPFIFERIKISKRKPSEIITEISEKLDFILNKKLDKKPLIRFKLEGELADGFLPVDIQPKSLIKKYSEKMILNIDISDVFSSDLKQRKKFLQKIIDRKESIETIGLELLMKSLNLSDPIVEELFNSLSEEDLERARETVERLEMK